MKAKCIKDCTIRSGERFVGKGEELVFPDSEADAPWLKFFEILEAPAAEEEVEVDEPAEDDPGGGFD